MLVACCSSDLGLVGGKSNSRPTANQNIKTILTEASPRLAHLEPASWPKQAQMAADGKWDELKEWQDNTKGGVEESEE